MNQEPSTLPEHQSLLAVAARVFKDAVSRHQRVALLYSGGLESSLLLHLAEPWRNKVTVYNMRTGAEFPHMIAFMDRKLAGWDHRVVTSDLMAFFEQEGIPSAVVPVAHIPSIGLAAKRPYIAPWTRCCGRHRGEIGWEAILADGIGCAILGRCASDGNNLAHMEHPAVECVEPLWDLSRENVMDAVYELGVEVPDHYWSEIPDSLDCSICPALLTPQKRAWMTQRYPNHLAAAEAFHSAVRQAALAELDGDNT
ncbi:argininosuccinate synthase [Bradyrhizobium huanghuaihaiense]